MIRVRLVCVGKLKEEFWRSACAEYQKRLSRFCKLEIKELCERAGPKEEAAELLSSCKGRVFALAIEGKACGSEEFAKKIGTLADAGQEMTFVIGSSLGLDGAVKQRADELLSFSQMTFPHQLMRVILLEQIYRAFTILAGSPYHK